MTQLIAHRGASFFAPENTMDAFYLAYHMGLKHMECDVVLTKDSIPIIIHDNTLDRTTSGTGVVSETYFRNIQSLSAGKWFAKSFEDSHVPTLQELLKWQKTQHITLNIEIKPIALPLLKKNLSIIMNCIHKYGDIDKIRLLSFQPEIFQQLKIIENQLPCALGVTHCHQQTVTKALQIGCIQINMHHAFISANHVNMIHQANLKIGAYTVNDYHELLRLKSLHIDEVFTDNPHIQNS
ncbi:MAG: hypothetical protein FJ186_03250 [Gammaproteobacteria bacterium]|nr:hypothetical protein [Gammaproteobacteria bacterium]